MGILKKLIYGNKKRYKVVIKCDDRLHSKVFVAVIDKDADINKYVNDKVTKKCNKCNIDIDEITVDEYKKASKFYETL